MKSAPRRQRDWDALRSCSSALGFEPATVDTSACIQRTLREFGQPYSRFRLTYLRRLQHRTFPTPGAVPSQRVVVPYRVASCKSGVMPHCTTLAETSKSDRGVAACGPQRILQWSALCQVNSCSQYTPGNRSIGPHGVKAQFLRLYSLRSRWLSPLSLSLLFFLSVPRWPWCRKLLPEVPPFHRQSGEIPFCLSVTPMDAAGSSRDNLVSRRAGGTRKVRCRIFLATT